MSSMIVLNIIDCWIFFFFEVEIDFYDNNVSLIIVVDNQWKYNLFDMFFFCLLLVKSTMIGRTIRPWRLRIKLDNFLVKSDLFLDETCSSWFAIFFFFWVIECILYRVLISSFTSLLRELDRSYFAFIVRLWLSCLSICVSHY